MAKKLEGYSEDELVAALQKKFQNSRNEFYPYINYIRFPHYKRLECNQKIECSFPLTVLVGRNGCNKTSVLQAFYGAPKGKSVSDYWFNTSVDTINENEGKQQFITGYYHTGANKVVETLKTRINKADNPDYWESARPQKKLDMEVVKKEDLRSAKNVSTTRWDSITKDVVFCDFKEYVSAFDLIFYHSTFKKLRTIKTKQARIRKRSSYLKKYIDSSEEKKLKEYEYYGKQRIESDETLDEDSCEVISYILGESYKSIRIIKHSLYGNNKHIKAANTILIKKENYEHTEAFAGAGEARLILLVHDILGADCKSLILIDEPEISLFPGAIKRFKNFLLHQCLTRQQQIIVTTHSPNLIYKLPDEAIKLLKVEEDKVIIEDNINYEEAFYDIGQFLSGKKTIITEDALAKELIMYVISLMNLNHLNDKIDIRYFGAGCGEMKKSMLTQAIIGSSEVYYVFDGDLRPEEEKRKQLVPYLNNNHVDIQKIPENDWEKNKITDILKCLIKEGVDIKVSGSNGNMNDKEMAKKAKKLIPFMQNNMFFLPGTNPEECLLELDKSEKAKLYSGDAKKYFKELATELCLQGENPTSEIILRKQVQYMRDKLTTSDSLYKNIEAIIKLIAGFKK